MYFLVIILFFLIAFFLIVIKKFFINIKNLLVYKSKIQIEWL